MRGCKLRRQGVRGLAIASLAAMAACAHPEAGAGASAPPSSPSEPGTPASSKIIKGDVQAFYAREVPPLPKTPFTVGPVSGEVESAAPPQTEQDDRSTRLTLSLGTGTPMKCFVYPQPMDVGSQLLSIVKAMTNVDIRSVRPTDVVVIGEQVAVFVEVQYLAKTSGGAALGEVKLMAYGHPIWPLLCMHDEVGYNAAFKRVTSGLASSLKVTGRELRIPSFVDISVERVDGHPVGFSRSATVVDEQGNKLYLESSSSLVPRSGQDMMVEDTSRVETDDKQGRLARVVYAKSEGGEISENLTLEHRSANEYRYEGIHLGKKIAGVLKTKGPKGFATGTEVRRGLRKLVGLGGKDVAELRVEEYHPDLDVGSPIEVLYRPQSKKDRTVTMTLGSAQVTLTLDADGLAQKGEMPIGGVTLTMDRVLLRGSL